ncbi:MAG: hypothetical protein LBG67_00160 [Campylobacteraceae bacterium]|nr:hypothetical protein [Campylobacteraceae bacterium]
MIQIFKNYEEFLEAKKLNPKINGATLEFAKENLYMNLIDCEGCWNCVNCINCKDCGTCTNCISSIKLINRFNYIGDMGD